MKNSKEYQNLVEAFMTNELKDLFDNQANLMRFVTKSFALMATTEEFEAMPTGEKLDLVYAQLQLVELIMKLH